MKIIKNILLGLSLIAIALLTSCKGSDSPSPQPDPQQEMIDALTKTWTVTEVTLDDVSVTGEWNNFSIQLMNDKTYSTTSTTNEQKLVWPIIGSYTFPDTNNPNMITRDDGVEITLSNVTETSATLSFRISNRGGRTDGLIGEWVFMMGN